MKTKIFLEKRDFNRTLLTDVLPYEVPFILTNEGFYRNLKNLKNSSDFISQILHNIFFNTFENTNPFIFKILKNDSTYRKLYLIHPSAQIKVSSFYKNYHQLICHLCNRSTYSLRYPHKIAKHYYLRDLHYRAIDSEYKDEGVELVSSEHQDPNYASTFFEYKDVDFLYKFYDSYRFHRIEKKFNKLLKFDIAKCFDSISTFQLARSVRGEYDYKFNEQIHSFEHKFEDLMKSCFNGNTHGIVIGPEFSRIFAEILLQSIDIKVKNKLLTSKSNISINGIIEGVHYNIKRYVDDYFLFYNDTEILNIVFNLFTEELSNYRLYCNEKKSVSSQVPFVTGITIAKQEIKKRLDEFFSYFDKLCDSDSTLKFKLGKYYQISNQLISDIKCIVFNNNIDYSSISGYFFTLIKVHVLDIKDKVLFFAEDNSNIESLNRILLIILDISFFIYSMNFKVRSTYLISQIIIFINSIAKEINSTDIIYKKIYDEVDFVVKNKPKDNILQSVEILNLLIAVRNIDSDYQILPDDLYIYFDNNDCTKYNYFSLMTFLYYVKRERKYQKIRDQIYNLIIRKLSHHYLNILNDSEVSHIFFDSLSCPYLTLLQKTKIAELGLTPICKLNQDDLTLFVKKIGEVNWFIDWDLEDENSIKRLLMKKELKSPYES